MLGQFIDQCHKLHSYGNNENQNNVKIDNKSW